MSLSMTHALQQAQNLGLERVDAERLLLHAVQQGLYDRAWLLTHPDTELTPEQLNRWQAALERRKDLEPVAYIVGEKEFFGLPLSIQPGVLDPRPDTEILVDWALEVLVLRPQPDILDLGCGSGAIALALKKNRPDARVQAADSSPRALEQTRCNALHLGLEVHDHLGHWLNGITQTFDLLVSNPPYLAADDAHLAALHHEPLEALVSGKDGLEALREITAQAQSRLKPEGWLLVEHGAAQAPMVRALLHAHGFLKVQSRRDLAGHERCSGGVKPGSAHQDIPYT
jgi:release factor glutamine methyltransferase